MLKYKLFSWPPLLLCSKLGQACSPWGRLVTVMVFQEILQTLEKVFCFRHVFRKKLQKIGKTKFRDNMFLLSLSWRGPRESPAENIQKHLCVGKNLRHMQESPGPEMSNFQLFATLSEQNT